MKNRAIIRSVGAATTIALMLAPACASWAQQRPAPQSSAPPASEVPRPDPDVEKFKRTVDLQANADQERKLRSMMASTELARQHARDLQQQAASSDDIVQLMHRATTLEDDVDQALTDYRIFRRSLSDLQEAEMKKAMKKLIGVVRTVGKNAEALSRELDHVPVNMAKVGSLAERLEKQLGALQSAQLSVQKEMSIAAE